MIEVKVGNMNRFVLKERKRQMRTHDSALYLYNALTGDIIVKNDKIFESYSNSYYHLRDDNYPIYKDGKYIGCMWYGEFLTPENFYN